MDTNEISSLMSLIDLTRLKNGDDPTGIETFCADAVNSLGHVAAVCVYHEFVQLARISVTDPEVKIATVINFPGGDNELSMCLTDIRAAHVEGVDEFDIVMPYKQILAGEEESILKFLKACKEACKGKTMKVIIETGALGDEQLIRKATKIAINGGADFVKTSTGKIKTGATIEAVTTMVDTIKENMPSDRTVGIKISGGVQTPAKAETFLSIIRERMGDDWISPNTVRIGASELLKNLLAEHQPV